MSAVVAAARADNIAYLLEEVLFKIFGRIFFSFLELWRLLDVYLMFKKGI